LPVKPAPRPIACDDLPSAPPQKKAHHPIVEKEALTVGIVADRKLVERCCSGEVAAWEELYAQCHDMLLASVRCLLGQARNDSNLVDEIAARVWYALVANDGELLAKFDPKRGARIITFMRAVAKDEICRFFRSERRRRRREQIACGEKSPHHSDDQAQSEAVLSEFWETLSPCEMGFATDHLLAVASADIQPYAKSSSNYSSANVWQLTHRIYSKFVKFFHYTPE
jgi:DNA-directed RNA polymerase specialized sigma24 family protein